MNQTQTEQYVKYKVKDIGLAEWGRKEIKLAEDEKIKQRLAISCIFKSQCRRSHFQTS